MSTRLEALLEAVAAMPSDPFPRYGLALEYKGLGRRDESADTFRALIAGHPDYVPGYLQAGMVLIDLGRADEAREVLTRGVEVAGRKGDGHAKSELMAALASMS